MPFKNEGQPPTAGRPGVGVAALGAPGRKETPLGVAVFPLDSGKNVHDFGSVCLCASVEQNLMRSKASTCDQPPAP